ncbi:Protein of unknown function [Thermobacillus xylanilyticus]|uniref:Uncharacterized protein n=1 Tax=Thermobacillus xylanilyticus TaxID=76633 RepID=A0ABN7S709_THEXY|nr:Protein of unknown function [Thermobacillus xylanilyticus]
MNVLTVDKPCRQSFL